MQTCWDIQRGTRISHAIEATILAGVGLPAFEAGDIELAVGRVESRPHGAAGELTGDLRDAALHLAVHFFLQHFVECGLAVGAVEEFIFQRAPFVAGDPDLSAVGVIQFRIDHPAQRLGHLAWISLGIRRFQRQMRRSSHPQKRAGFHPVNRVDRHPATLVIADRHLAARADAHAIGCAQAGGIVFDFAAIGRDFKDRTMILRNLLEPPATGMHRRSKRKIEVAGGVGL